MLVLSRETGDQTYVYLPDGRRVTVCIVNVDRNKVRLGFDAPRDIRIERDDVKKPHTEGKR